MSWKASHNKQSATVQQHASVPKNLQLMAAADKSGEAAFFSPFLKKEEKKNHKKQYKETKNKKTKAKVVQQ